MRPLEATLTLLLAVFFLWPLGSRRQAGRFSLLPVLILVVAALHLFLEGQRWQMWPLYALVVLAVLQSLAQRRRLLAGGSRQPAERISPRVWLQIGLLFAFLLAAAIPVLLPIPSLPAPTGPYPVGTTTLYLVDTSRTELYSGDANAPRELMVQIWYPAEPREGEALSPWLPGVEQIAPALARSLGFPSFFVSHVHLARTHSYQDAALSGTQAQYPLLLFAHGWGGLRVQNTYQVEELASYGYVVAAADHTYGAAATVFPDGRIALQNDQALPVDLPLAELEPAANRLVSQWASDMGFILDELARLNAGEAGDRFMGRLDLDHVGVLGHSTGGGAAIEFCARDRRCIAGLSMDAYLTPVSKSVLESGLSQPFLFMFSESWSSGRNNSLFDRLYQHMSGPAYHMVIAGTSHYDFTDTALISPVAHQLGLKGPLPARRGLRLIDDYTLAFFDRYLLDQAGTGLEDLSESYPEVSFAAHP